MKRFWKAVAIGLFEGQSAILLDGRPVRTPGRALLVPPNIALAEAIAAEWDGRGETVDPRTMPFTGLVNAAIDRIAPDRDRFATDLALYAESDLLCYRAEHPAPLVNREQEAWNPLLDWARKRFDIHFEVVTGIIHRAQPSLTIARLAEALRSYDPFSLAALSPLITISGSLVTALALAEGAIAAEAAFDATHLDELWQAENWGEDQEAAIARAARKADFLAAAQFLALLNA